MTAIRVVDESPRAADVVTLLEAHLADMRRTSPPGSVHALPVEALAAPHVRFLTARDGDGVLLGCGAVQDLGGEGEVKSMRTEPAARGRGVASQLLRALIAIARDSGWSRLSLETGTQPFFAPAVRLYLRHGFVPCGPFGAYTEDPSSRYLTLDLRPVPGEHLSRP